MYSLDIKVPSFPDRMAISLHLAFLLMTFIIICFLFDIFPEVSKFVLSLL